jgi:hypothetical protein
VPDLRGRFCLSETERVTLKNGEQCHSCLFIAPLRVSGLLEKIVGLLVLFRTLKVRDKVLV